RSDPEIREDQGWLPLDFRSLARRAGGERNSSESSQQLTARLLVMPRSKAVEDMISYGNASTTNRIVVADGGCGAIAMERVRMAFVDAELLTLNLEVAPREEAGQSVTAPRIPPSHPDLAEVVERWRSLTPEIRAEVLELVRSGLPTESSGEAITADR